MLQQGDESRPIGKDQTYIKEKGDLTFLLECGRILISLG